MAYQSFFGFEPAKKPLDKPAPNKGLERARKLSKQAEESLKRANNPDLLQAARDYFTKDVPKAVGGVAKSVVDTTKQQVQAVSDVGQMASGGNEIRRRVIENQRQLLEQGLKDKKISQQEYDRGINRLSVLTKENQRSIQGTLERTKDRTKTAANVTGAFLDVALLPVGGGGLVSSGVKTGSGQLAKNVVRGGAEGALTGSAYGSLQTLRDNGSKTDINQLAQGAGAGAAFGGVLGGALPAVGAAGKQIVVNNRRVKLDGAKEVNIKSLTSYEGAPDRAAVDAYKARIQSGEPIEPLIVKKDSLGNYGIEDGKHRFQAYKELGVSKVPVIGELAPPKPNTGRAGKFTRQLDAIDNKLSSTEDPVLVAKLNADKRNVIQKAANKNQLSLAERFNNAAVDRMFTTRKRVNEALKSKNINSQNVLDQLEYSTGNVSRSSLIADQYMKDNGFEAVMKQLGTKERENQFSEYLLAKQREYRRSNGEVSQEFMKGAAQDKKTIEAFRDEYEDLAQQLHQYSQNFLRQMASPDSVISPTGKATGIIDPQLAEQLIKDNPEYVPLNKILQEVENNGGVSSNNIGSLSKQTIVNKFKGAAGAEKNPLESIYEKTQTGFNQIARNETAGVIKNLSTIPDNPLGIKVIEEGTKLPKGRGKISFMNQGKKELIEVPDYVETALKGLNPAQGNTFIRGLYMINRIRKLGFTGASPGFAVRNIPRDIEFKAVVGRSGFRALNPVDLLKGWKDAIIGSATRDEAQRLGAFGNLVDTFRPTGETLGEIRRSGASKIATKITNPRELFRTLEDAVSLTETSSRASAYRTRYRQVLKETGDKREAQLQAALSARRDSTDFFVAGEWGDLIKGWGLYLNPSIQGTRRFGQALREQPVGTTARLAATIIGPSIATTYWNMSDENRRKVYEDLPQYEKDSNFVIVGPNAKWNSKTKKWDGVYKIPKVPGIREFGNTAEKLVVKGMEDGINMGDVVKELGFGVANFANPESSFGGAVTPDPVEPLVNIATNKDFFTGKEIVPEDQKYRKALEDKASPTAKTVAEKLKGLGIDASPLQVDSLIRNMTGSTGQGFQNIAESAAGAETPGGKSFVNQVTGSFVGSSGGEKKRQLQEKLTTALESKATVSSDITDALKNNDRKRANQLALRYNRQVAEIEKLAQDDRARLTEGQKKLLDGLRFSMKGNSLTKRSIDARLRD